MSINAASYRLNHGKAFQGMVADGELANIISKLNTDTVTIAYGKAVVRDGDNAAKARMQSGCHFVDQAVAGGGNRSARFLKADRACM